MARGARRILLLDLGFLGDTVHLLPSAWCIRQAFPQAQLHVMTAAHVRELLRLAPWIDRSWGYVRFPTSLPLYRQGPILRQLRAEKFDLVINLNGSDRSSILTRLTGAPLRLGRRPEGGGSWFWRQLFTHVVEQPYGDRPVLAQRFHCLLQAGFPGARPEFHVQIPPETAGAIASRLETANPFVHVSPFTTQDFKEIPPSTLAEVLNRLARWRPGLKIVLSCGPDARERTRMAALAGRLECAPWRVFAGDLSLLELTALISRSALHLGGDSGALHLAWMTGVPALAWFREYPRMRDWLPDGPQHRVFVGQASPNGIAGLDAAEMLGAAADLLAR